MPFNGWQLTLTTKFRKLVCRKLFGIWFDKILPKIIACKGYNTAFADKNYASVRLDADNG